MSAATSRKGTDLVRYVVTAPVPELSAELDYVLVLDRGRSYLLYEAPNATGTSDTIVRILAAPRTAILKLLNTRSEAFVLVDRDLVPNAHPKPRAAGRARLELVR